MTYPRIGLVASRVRYEEKRIIDTAKSLGIALSRIDSRTFLPTDEASIESPQVYLNREISSSRGDLVGHTLEAHGIRLINPSNAQSVANDKWRTQLILSLSGVQTPRTFAVSSMANLIDATTRIPPPWILKPRNGSWGKNVALAKDFATAQSLYEYCIRLPDPESRIILVQEYIADAQDLRTIVVGGKVLGTIERRNPNGLRKNISLGSTPLFFESSEYINQLALDVSKMFGLDACGVDIMRNKNDDLFVLEVNPGLEFQGFEIVHGPVVAEALVNLCLELTDVEEICQ